MISKSLPSITLSVISVLSTFTAVSIELPEILSDNAVLQQKTDAPLWGWSKPGDTVTIVTSWDGKEYSVLADKNGKWRTKVSTPSASFTPYNIVFKDSDGTEKIDNVMIGEVWLCSGQSNMEMPLRGFWTQPVEGSAQTIAYSGKYPGIRVVTIPKLGSYEPQEKAPGKWKTSNPNDAAEFTALGYHFAQSLTDILNVPIGIISCAYGGSKVEGWIPKEKLSTYTDFDLEKEKATTDSLLQEYERINVMYNAMLHPIIGYAVKGFLWNQGESNVGRESTYPRHQADMVEIWREEWENPELPFYFVELPSWNYGNPDGTNASLFRECQHESVSLLPNSDIVCTTDLVKPDELNDIHASKKKEIGERLAFMAAAKTYGIYGTAHTYPRYKDMTVDGNRAVLRFNNADNGFTPNDVLEGFEAAGADRVFHPAQATEDWSTRNIIVTCPEVDKIEAVRYCFKNFAPGKVKDLMGMPLVPFRTDRW